MPENINIIREVLIGTPAGFAPNDPAHDPADDVPISGMREVTVSVQTDNSPDELWQSWQDMRLTIKAAGDRMDRLGELWRQTTNRRAKARLWADYEVAARNYRVLASWKDVLYAAYIFSTDGADGAGLDDGCVPIVIVV